MSDLQKDLYAASDKFFAKAGTILTPADKPEIEALIKTHMHPWVLDKIVIDMIDGDNPETEWDESDTLKITVKVGRKTASVELQWKDDKGNTWMRIDTDGDGA